MLWFRRKKHTPFRKVAERVLRLKKLKSKNTNAAATRQLTRLIRHFGHIPIQDITEDRWIEYLIIEKAKGDRRFYDDRKYMRQVLSQALRESLITRKIALPIPDIPRHVGREISKEELEKLLEAAGQELRFQIEIAWKMGLRLREMLHLRWDQFDWTERTIALENADTKTRKGRTIPINPDLVEHFEGLKGRSTSRYVFPSPTDPNKPIQDNKTAWKRCKAKVGVHARWHDLRHTCASEMVRRGIKPHIAKQYLGMTEHILLRIYLHLNNDDLRGAALAMSEKATEE